MARISERAKRYTKGKADKGYWGTEVLKDILWDIYTAHKSWGDEWYNKVRLHQYESAKVLLAIHGKGQYVGKSIDIINELIEREEGEQ